MRPEFVEVNGKLYKINTSFKVGLECEKIATDESIGDYERALAIIYKLFGDEGLNDIENQEKLLELAIRYLKCDKDDESNGEDPDMDFQQDYDYIEASFITDHQIDLETTDMHWWKFFNLLNGLTENCVLNRIRYIRDYDISQIKDSKEKQKWIKQKKQVSLNKKEKKLSKEENLATDKFYSLLEKKR